MWICVIWYNNNMISSFLFLLVFWVTAGIIFYFGPKLLFIRLIGWIAIVISFTPLSEMLEKFVLPNIQKNTIWFHLIIVIIGYFYTIAYYFYPCLLVIFSLIFSKLIKKYKFLSLLVFIPAFFMYIFVPINFSFPLVPVNILSFKILNLWVIPYIVLSNCILFYTFINETNPILKKQSLVNFIIIFLPTITSLFLGNLYPELNRNEFCRIIQILTFVVPYFYYLNHYGAFGLKLNFEKKLYENNLQVINYGASYINHTVKNEAAKIKACLSLLEKRLPQNDKEQSYLNTISSSINQILSFTDLIQKKIQILNLLLQPMDLQSIVAEVLQGFTGVLETKKIKVNQNYSYKDNIYVDIIYIREVISNIIINAIEALPDGGELNFESYKQKNWIVLEINDTGSGIAREDLVKVFEPFYSTKEGQNNLGLGLTYCYNVMQKHGGELILQSTVGKGSTAYLKFPVKAGKLKIT